MPSALMGLTTSDNTLAPLGGSQIDAAIDALEPYAVLRYASTAARDTAHPATVGGRKAGTVVWVPTVGYHQTVLADGGGWVPLATRDTFAGGENAIVGAYPPAGTFKIRREGTAVFAVLTGSFVQLGLGSNFPNGIVTAQVTPGDEASNLGITTVANGSTTLTTLTVIVRTYTGATIGAGNLVRVNWSVVGW